MNVKTLSIALSLMLVAHPGLRAAYDVRSADDDVRKVPKEGQKKEEPKKEEPKKEEPNNEEPNNDKGSGGDKPLRCHTERYICDYEKVCPDGNNNLCWEKPIWCSREVCDPAR